MLQWILGCIYLFELVFSFSSGKYPEVKLLDHMAVLFLIFWGISIMFSIVAVPIYNSNCAWGYPFLHTLTSTCYFLSSCWEPFWQVCEVKVIQSCPTLCDPMDCSLPGFSVHGILQARIMEWVSRSLLRGDLPKPGIEPRSPELQADSLPSEPPGKTGV